MPEFNMILPEKYFPEFVTRGTLPLSPSRL